MVTYHDVFDAVLDERVRVGQQVYACDKDGKFSLCAIVQIDKELSQVTVRFPDGAHQTLFQGNLIGLDP